MERESSADEAKWSVIPEIDFMTHLLRNRIGNGGVMVESYGQLVGRVTCPGRSLTNTMFVSQTILARDSASPVPHVRMGWWCRCRDYVARKASARARALGALGVIEN